MASIFVNFTNHPSEAWDFAQKEAASAYGEIVDIPFPVVDPSGDSAYIMKLADEYERMILDRQPAAVLCQGEFCLAFQMITRLKEKGIPVFAACSERIVRTEGNRKISVFEFKQFRRF